VDSGAYTVVVPAFNAAATIAETIRSALAQTVPPAEIIVIDDGSADSTADVAGAFGAPVRVVRQENTGPGGATTRGLSETKTPFVATLDSDDLWVPKKAERQLALLAASPDVAAVFGKLKLFTADASDPRNGRIVPGWTRTTLMMRTALFAKIGGIVDLPGNLGELVDWLGRAREAGEKLVMIDEVWGLRRIRQGSLSDGRDPARDRGYVHAAWKAIQRRRSEKPGT
jgi:glycosyltransferase involved in cell wall biosynthesis